MSRFLPPTFLVLILLASASAGDWPQFRGPTGQGHADGPLPLEWGPDKNVVWKEPVAGLGWSSPVVVAGRIYLTTAVPTEQNMNDLSLRTICLDAKTGKPKWDVEVFVEDAKDPKPHSKNSHASPTPIVEGDRLYVHFGHEGTACLDLDGKVLWRKVIKYKPVHGNGGSPVIVDDMLIFSCDGGDIQVVVGLNKKTGEEVWRTDRKKTAKKGFAFCTPLVIEVDGKKQVVSPGPGAVVAYEPKTGAEIWRARYGEGYSVVPRPVFAHGLVFVSSGYDSPVFLAIRPDGKGDVTETHIAWTTKKGAPRNASPLIVGDELYIISDEGAASCLDAKTGTLHWHERLPGAYSASPVYADGKIFFQNEDAMGVVIQAGKEFKQLAKNPLKEKSLASFAAVDGALFVRTEKNLYRFEALR